MDIYPIIPHDNLPGFVANEHIDHTAVTMTAGTGLTGGGTIAANRTFNVAANIAAINALAVTDGNFIVGNGSTWIAETGATVRTSLGLGTGNTVTFDKVLVGDGAVGAPSLGFASDTDNGFYLDSGPSVCAAIGGVKSFKVESNQIGIKEGLSANFGVINFSGTAMTAERAFTLNLDDGDRTLKMSNNLTVEAASVINSDLSTNANWATSGTMEAASFNALTLTVNFPGNWDIDDGTSSLLVSGGSAINSDLQTNANWETSGTITGATGSTFGNLTLADSSISAGATKLALQSDASIPITMFEDATSGETPELKIYGYRGFDSKRSLEIGVGVDAPDSASFDGVSTYRFYGALQAVTIAVAGLQIVGARQAHIIDADGTLADITTKFNTLLSYLDADAGHGLLAGA